ncbi:hypothetical protein LZ30DRAFT_697695 [Colletotrichum cereale]|nr:hypothetical protein LZ30DRAFT_697695 [Colletotrichum cereale]
MPTWCRCRATRGADGYAWVTGLQHLASHQSPSTKLHYLHTNLASYFTQVCHT